MNQALFFLLPQPFSISHRKLLPSHTVLSLQPWGLSTVDYWVIWTQHSDPFLGSHRVFSGAGGRTRPLCDGPRLQARGSLLMSFIFAEKLSKVDSGEERKVW